MLRELQNHLGELEKVIQATPWHDRRVYGAFLSQTYYYVCHTTRILSLAASRFRFSENKIHRRFVKHATEEMSHDVLVLRDLKQLELSAEQFPEFTATRAFYQTQYYMIEHESPWSIWGWILMLEGLALTGGPWLYERIKQHHGDPAASFLRVHVADDIHHMAEAEKALQALPEHERPLVLEQIGHSRFLYSAILRHCASYAEAQPMCPAA